MRSLLAKIFILVATLFGGLVVADDSKLLGGGNSSMTRLELLTAVGSHIFPRDSSFIFGTSTLSALFKNVSTTNMYTSGSLNTNSLTFETAFGTSVTSTNLAFTTATGTTLNASGTSTFNNLVFTTASGTTMTVMSVVSSTPAVTAIASNVTDAIWLRFGVPGASQVAEITNSQGFQFKSFISGNSNSFITNNGNFSIKNNTVTTFTQAPSSFVGINKSSPTVQFDVVTSTASGTTVMSRYSMPDGIGNNVCQDFAVGAGSPATVNRICSQYTSSGNVGMSFSTFSSSLQERLRISADGKVGIATTTPSALLSVQGGAGLTSLSIVSSTGSNVLNADSSGNVNIGSLSINPAKLVIKGSGGDIFAAENAAGTRIFTAADNGQFTMSNNLRINGAQIFSGNNSSDMLLYTIFAPTGIMSIANASTSVGFAVAGPNSGGMATDFFQIRSNWSGPRVGDVLAVTKNKQFGFNSSTPSATGVFQSVGDTTSSLWINSTSATKGACLVMKDTGGTGTTYCTTNAGTLSCSTVSCL